jgi:ElaB/YqjD/DUF883 family membrane-anchored ribosome-binding protein
MNEKTVDTISADMLATKEQFMVELRSVILDVERLLESASSQAGEGTAVACERILESLQILKDRMVTAENTVIERTKKVAKITDQYIHENPWQSMGISACAGVIVGMLVARR